MARNGTTGSDHLRLVVFDQLPPMIPGKLDEGFVVWQGAAWYGPVGQCMVWRGMAWTPPDQFIADPEVSDPAMMGSPRSGRGLVWLG